MMSMNIVIILILTHCRGPRSLTQYLEFGGLLVAKSNNSKIQKQFQTFASNCCFQQPLSMYAVQSFHRLNGSKKAYSYSHIHDGCVQTFDLICKDCNDFGRISLRALVY